MIIEMLHLIKIQDDITTNTTSVNNITNTTSVKKANQKYYTKLIMIAIKVTLQQIGYICSIFYGLVFFDCC